jgi:hypothetical protein
MISSEICILSGGEEVLELADYSKHNEISLKHHSPKRSRDDLKRHLDFVPRPDEYKSISPIRAQDAKIGETTLKLSYYYDEYNPKNVGKKVSLFSRKQSGMAKSGNVSLVPENYKPSIKQKLSLIKKMVENKAPEPRKINTEEPVNKLENSLNYWHQPATVMEKSNQS